MQRSKTPNTTSVQDMTQKSDDATLITLELWGMWSTSLLPSLPGTLWPGVVACDRNLSMGQIELNCVLVLN